MADLAPSVVEPVLAAIADIDPDHLNDREVIAFLAGISETTTGLLQAKPDLKAHADLVMDLANRVFHANGAAEERGYRKAIADLRDDRAYSAWRRDTKPAGMASSTRTEERAHLAAFLESHLTEGPTP